MTTSVFLIFLDSPYTHCVRYSYFSTLKSFLLTQIDVLSDIAETFCHISTFDRFLTYLLNVYVASECPQTTEYIFFLPKVINLKYRKSNGKSIAVQIEFHICFICRENSS